MTRFLSSFNFCLFVFSDPVALIGCTGSLLVCFCIFSWPGRLRWLYWVPFYLFIFYLFFFFLTWSPSLVVLGLFYFLYSGFFLFLFFFVFFFFSHSLVAFIGCTRSFIFCILEFSFFITWSVSLYIVHIFVFRA